MPLEQISVPFVFMIRNIETYMSKQFDCSSFRNSLQLSSYTRRSWPRKSPLTCLLWFGPPQRHSWRRLRETRRCYAPIWAFPNIRGTILGVPIIRIVVCRVYIGVPLFRETPISSFQSKAHLAWQFCSKVSYTCCKYAPSLSISAVALTTHAVTPSP